MSLYIVWRCGSMS